MSSSVPPPSGSHRVEIADIPLIRRKVNEVIRTLTYRLEDTSWDSLTRRVNQVHVAMSDIRSTIGKKVLRMYPVHPNIHGEVEAFHRALEAGGEEFQNAETSLQNVFQEVPELLSSRPLNEMIEEQQLAEEAHSSRSNSEEIVPMSVIGNSLQSALSQFRSGNPLFSGRRITVPLASLSSDLQDRYRNFGQILHLSDFLGKPQKPGFSSRMPAEEVRNRLNHFFRESQSKNNVGSSIQKDDSISVVESSVPGTLISSKKRVNSKSRSMSPTRKRTKAATTSSVSSALSDAMASFAMESQNLAALRGRQSFPSSASSLPLARHPPNPPPPPPPPQQQPAMMYAMHELGYQPPQQQQSPRSNVASSVRVNMDTIHNVPLRPAEYFDFSSSQRS